MASSTPKTIVIKHNPGGPNIHSALADAALTPGELLKVTATGFAAHNAGSEFAVPLFAVENPWDDGGASAAAIDVDYASSDTAQAVLAQRGEQVYAWLAAGENASVFEALVSAGTASPGDLACIGSGTPTLANANCIVGYAAEAKNNSSGTVRVRVKVTVA